MIVFYFGRLDQWLRSHWYEVSTWLFTTLALAALAVGVLATLSFWPVTYLGYSADLRSGLVLAIEPDGLAERVGLHINDRIVAIYGVPFQEALQQWSVLPLIDAVGQNVPLVVERSGITRTFTLALGTPPIEFQATKAVSALLALMCWLTGWLLGVMRRHEVATASLTVPMFWIVLGGLLGVYQFAHYASLPLFAVCHWLLLTILAPLGIYIHLWFPARSVSRAATSAARLGLLSAWLGLNLLLLATIAYRRPSLPELVALLAPLTPLALGIAFVASGGVLYRAYRRVQVAHTRRQIRLIALACFVVASIWLALLAVPALYGEIPPVPGYWLDLLTGLIPLAYLCGGILPNLYQLDQALRRLAVFVTSVVALAVLLTLVSHQLPANTPARLGLVLVGVLFWHPFATLMRRLFLNEDRSYAALHTALHQLATTLERPKLVAALHKGIRATFNDPRFGLYLRDASDANTFRLAFQAHAAYLPLELSAGGLIAELAERVEVREARRVYQCLRGIALTRVEEALLHEPAMALFGPLRSSQGELVGVMLIGADRNLDPYQAADLREVQRLADGASLAFANSNAYEQRHEAELIIRGLYHEVQRIQDETAATIARELHDEIININLRLNIQSLHWLLEQGPHPDLRNELETLLTSEQTIVELLRVMCERLQPEGVNDPLGLPALLRLHVERAQSTWSGNCRLTVLHEPVPVSEHQQREVLRIVREGLTNAVKHAEATTITVTLVYPVPPAEQIVVLIEDNGRSGQAVRPRTGHRGVRGMIESAHAAYGELRFEQCEVGGTRLVFRFPPTEPEPSAKIRERYLVSALPTGTV